MDEMAIRKHYEWDGKRFRGFVDIGTEVDEDNLPVATEALVLMLVSLNSCWKLPIGYYLFVGMTRKERASMVNNCFIQLCEVGVAVTSVTCDGAASNQAMFSELGATISANKMKAYFAHPSDTNSNVNLLLDVCHMLKLVRNTMASQTIYNGNKQEITWSYIEKLHKMQQASLRAGNKLRAAHIDW